MFVDCLFSFEIFLVLGVMQEFLFYWRALQYYVMTSSYLSLRFLAAGGGTIATFLQQVKVHIPHSAVVLGCFLMVRGGISGCPPDLCWHVPICEEEGAPWYCSLLDFHWYHSWWGYLLPLGWDQFPSLSSLIPTNGGGFGNPGTSLQPAEGGHLHSLLRLWRRGGAATCFLEFGQSRAVVGFD